MLQFTNTDLDAALAPGQERTIRPLLQIDWFKDALFASPASQLTSDNLIDVQCIDDVDSGLPDEVTGRPTASSTTLTAVLHGSTQDGQPLWQLFSPWNRDSAYHGMDLTGSAVQFSIFTATEGGSTETRRFTGWIDTVKVDRVQGTVMVVAANNLHLLGHAVTLPRWARSTNVFDGLAHVTGWDIPDEDRMENAPLTAAYLFQNVMRQCNAVPGPDPRSDSIWFSSGYGGMIPEKGGLGDSDQTGSAMSQGIGQYNFPQNWGYPNFNRDILSFSELGFPSPFVEGSQASGTNGDIFDIYSQSAATVEINPIAGQPRFLNGGLWCRIPSGDSGAFVDQAVFLDPWKSGVEADLCKVRLVVGASNTTLTIRNTAAGSLRTLTVATPTTKDTLIYVSWELDFANPANMKIWYNNTLQTGSLSGVLNTYPTLAAGWVGTGRYQSKVRVWCRHAGFANAEVRLTTVAQVGSTRVPTWANTPYGRKDFAFINGGIQGAVNVFTDFKTFENTYEGSGTMPRVTYIPVREKVDAWELLKEMCAAFSFTMWIDAFGGLRVMPQGVLSILEQRLADPRKDLDGDSLSGISLQLSSDSVRDRIQYSERSGRAFDDIVYRAQTSEQFSAPASSVRTFVVPLPPESVGVPSYLYAVQSIGLGGGGFTWVDSPTNAPLAREGRGGYTATEVDGDAGTNVAVWPVYVYLDNAGQSQSTVTVRIDNQHTQRIYLALANAASPGSGRLGGPDFAIRGTLCVLSEVQTYSQGSGARLLVLPLSDFHSAAWTMNATIAALLQRASQSVPRADDVTVPGDPRREVYDMIDLHDPDGGVATAICQIIGRSDSWSSSDGYSQRLTIRLVFAPDSWLMEIDGFTEADQTTYFG